MTEDSSAQSNKIIKFLIGFVHWINLKINIQNTIRHSQIISKSYKFWNIEAIQRALTSFHLLLDQNLMSFCAQSFRPIILTAPFQLHSGAFTDILIDYIYCDLLTLAAGTDFHPENVLTSFATCGGNALFILSVQLPELHKLPSKKKYYNRRSQWWRRTIYNVYVCWNFLFLFAISHRLAQYRMSTCS